MNNPPFNEWPLHPSRNDISRHLFELFPPAFVKNHPDALVEKFDDMLGFDLI